MTNQNKTTFFAKTLVLVLVLFFALPALAWQDPPTSGVGSTPPECDTNRSLVDGTPNPNYREGCNVPINAGLTTQKKSGALELGMFFSTQNFLSDVLEIAAAEISGVFKLTNDAIFSESGALNIFGRGNGTVGSPRNVKVWDNLGVNGSIRANRPGGTVQYLELFGGDPRSIDIRGVSTKAAEKPLIIGNLSGEATPGVGNRIDFKLGTLLSSSTKMSIGSDGTTTFYGGVNANGDICSTLGGTKKCLSTGGSGVSQWVGAGTNMINYPGDRVGIRSASPLTTLDVRGNSMVAGTNSRLTLGGLDPATNLTWQLDNSGGTFRIFSQPNVITGGQAAMTINKVSVDPAPANFNSYFVGKITASGDICTTGTSPAKCLSTAGVGSGGSDKWPTTTGAYVGIHYDVGNVGIGQPNPITKLSVLGIGSFDDGIIALKNSTLFGATITGKATVTDSLILPYNSINLIDTGAGDTGRNSDAGKIGYKKFSTSLDIVGAGTSNGNRSVKIWDNLNVVATTTTGSLVTNYVCSGINNCRSTIDIVNGGGLPVGNTTGDTLSYNATTKSWIPSNALTVFSSGGVNIIPKAAPVSLDVTGASVFDGLTYMKDLAVIAGGTLKLNLVGVGAGKVLTSDKDGYASWANASSDKWASTTNNKDGIYYPYNVGIGYNAAAGLPERFQVNNDSGQSQLKIRKTGSLVDIGNTGNFEIQPVNVGGSLAVVPTDGYVGDEGGQLILAGSNKPAGGGYKSWVFDSYRDNVRLFPGLDGNRSIVAPSYMGLIVSEVNGEGRVGVNNLWGGTPAYNLDVRGTMRATGDITAEGDVNVAATTTTLNLKVTGRTEINGTNFNICTGNNVCNPIASILGGDKWASTTSGTAGIYYLSGAVGIGTKTPNNTFQVADLINFGNNQAEFNNTSLGYLAGKNITSAGVKNTAFGYQALANNTSADNNTAVGWRAIANNTTGSYNTGVGMVALASNTTGQNNTAMGNGAMLSNTVGSSNTAVGQGAIGSNTGGDLNVAVGDGALFSNTVGSQNTAVGTVALRDSAGGLSNTAVGYAALSKNTTGQTNTALGNWASYYNTTGTGNTALGDHALQNNSSGSYNVAIGYNAGVALNQSALTNTITIGKNVQAKTSNTMLLGGTGVNAVNVGIGKDSPTVSLDVVGDVCSQIGTNPRKCLSSAGADPVTIAKANFWATSTTNAANIYYTGTGNVGLGINAPVAKLDVRGNVMSAGANSRFTLGGANPTNNLTWQLDNTTSGEFRLFSQPNLTTGGHVAMTVNKVSTDPANGNFNTYFAGKVTASGDICTSAVAGGKCLSTAGTDIWKSSTVAGSSYYAGTGNIGIGNPSPSNKLDVTGTAGITSNLTVGGKITSAGDICSSASGSSVCISSLTGKWADGTSGGGIASLYSSKPVAIGEPTTNIPAGATFTTGGIVMGKSVADPNFRSEIKTVGDNRSLWINNAGSGPTYIGGKSNTVIASDTGRLGVGIAPTKAKFEVGGNIYMGPATAGADSRLILGSKGGSNTGSWAIDNLNDTFRIFQPNIGKERVTIAPDGTMTVDGILWTNNSISTNGLSIRNATVASSVDYVLGMNGDSGVVVKTSVMPKDIYLYCNGSNGSGGVNLARGGAGTFGSSCRYSVGANDSSKPGVLDMACPLGYTPVSGGADTGSKINPIIESRPIAGGPGGIDNSQLVSAGNYGWRVKADVASYGTLSLLCKKN